MPPPILRGEVFLGFAMENIGKTKKKTPKKAVHKVAEFIRSYGNRQPGDRAILTHGTNQYTEKDLEIMLSGGYVRLISLDEDFNEVADR